MVFDHLVAALVFGAGYERIADASCSATTLRRRRDEWIRLGIFDRLRLACLDAYLALATAIVMIRALLRAAWYRYRWNTRPRSPRIR